MSEVDDETEIDEEEYEMEVDGEECRTVEDVPIETTLPHCNGQTRKIVRQSARHLKRKQTNTIQPKLSQPNLHLQCSHCAKPFVYNSKLQTHLRVHTGERPFQCDMCDKRFNQNSNLNKHQLIHQNIKRFQCDQCDKQFTHKYTLEDHQRTHSGERPFKCNFCERSFAKRLTRNTHEQAIHLHVKPYRCKQCAHTATHQSTIIKHIRVVHFGLPKSIKQQRALNIADDRDPRKLIEKV